MAKAKVHLQHPRFGYHACGAGGDADVEMTTDPEKVTCLLCQATRAGRKAAPDGYPNLSRAGAGAPLKGPRSRINTQVSPDARDYLLKLGGSARKIGAAIETLVAFHQKHQDPDK